MRDRKELWSRLDVSIAKSELSGIVVAERKHLTIACLVREREN